MKGKREDVEIIEGEKIYFNDLPAEAEAKRIMLATDPFLKVIIKRNVTKNIFAEFKGLANGTQNFINSWFGNPGDGKSYSCIYTEEKIAEYKKVELSIDNVVFRPRDALEMIGTVNDNEIIIIDEQTVQTGEGSHIDAVNLRNVESTIRATGISFGFCAPYLISHPHRYYFKTWQRGGYTPINYSQKEWDKKDWKFTKLIVYKGGIDVDIPIGYMITGTPENKKFLKKYDKKKNEYMGDAKSLKFGGRYKDILKYAKKIADDDENLKRFIACTNREDKKLIVNEALQGINISTTELRQIIGKIESMINFDGSYRQRALDILEKSPQLKFETIDNIRKRMTLEALNKDKRKMKNT